MKRFSRQLHFFQNVCRLGRPDERLGRVIRGSDVRLDRGNQLLDADEHTAFQALTGQVAEETLHHVQPGRSRGREVQMKTRMLRQPSFHRGVLMRGIIIQNQMHFAVRRRLLFDQFQKLEPFLMPVSILALANDFSVRHVEGGKKGGRAMAHIVVRHRAGAAFLSGANLVACDPKPALGFSRHSTGRSRAPAR